MATFLFLIVLGVLFFRMTGPDERERLRQSARAAAARAMAAAAARAAKSAPFRQLLRERTRRVVATPALAAVHVVVFVSAAAGAGSMGDPAALLAWGASLGPRTTNGEWWRLVTATFVHSGFFELLVGLAALVQIGLVLERLVGPLAFVLLYLCAGIFAGLMSLSAQPVGVVSGSAGAIAGLYGFLLAAAGWAWLRRSAVTIPAKALQDFVPIAAIFVLSNVLGGSLPAGAVIAGVGSGLLCGLALAKNAGERTTTPREVAAVMAGVAVVAAALAGSLRGITDARPEVETVVALEDRTAGEYRTAVEGWKERRTTTAALCQLIEEKIVPDLEAADARLEALAGVPGEQRPLVDAAREFLRLREESWRVRAEGLRSASVGAVRPAALREDDSDAARRRRAEARHQANTQTLGRSEELERASLDVLQRIAPPRSDTTAPVEPPP